MFVNKKDYSDKKSILIISACPADLQFCLGALKKQVPETEVLVLITWANGSMQKTIAKLFPHKKSLNVEIEFFPGNEACTIALGKKWASIYLFTMGADWLGRILFERKDILHYRDCYLDYDQLELRDIEWSHLEIISFHGLNYWLKMQILRVWTCIKYHRYKLVLKPDMHIWPQTKDMQCVWEEVYPDKSLKLTELPTDSVIFCLSSIDNGWVPDWAALRGSSKNFFYKVHPRTGSPDYLEYPKWVLPLTGYDLPMELYSCPDSSLLIGTTSTALGASLNSISLWRIKLTDWKSKAKENRVHHFLFKESSIEYLNCRDDLYLLYNAYALRARFIPYNNQELVENMKKSKSI